MVSYKDWQKASRRVPNSLKSKGKVVFSEDWQMSDEEQAKL
jgi:hypothetical protein